MDDNDLYFEAMQNMELEARNTIAGAGIPGEEIAGDEFDNEDLEEHLDPNLFYLACQKALVRLKTYAASNPSF